ncbi:hypothetical protein L0657_04380 [Dyadobacter sp. CY345]|uniref:hypothetical protein n=1 Tax=Dyadobacter sp. CY345 TaxID=2909335 RepID=UPI001F26B8DA|nr:hypothetical protein [Dyadobacter sp. CY345]MCF2443185.1 hypothetical protein [Dyadobacter sp. CY345]
MKNHYVILFLLFSVVSSYGQNVNRLTVNYGIASQVLIQERLEGAGSHDGKGGNVAGLRYIHGANGKVALETGLEYSRYKFSTTPASYPDIKISPIKENLELISIPIYANFTFAKYMFINGGLIADFQINKKKTDVVDRQSGIGLGVGIGGKYDFKRITFSINPCLQQHAVIPFESARSPQRLLEAGIRFGVGYHF